MYLFDCFSAFNAGHIQGSGVRDSCIIVQNSDSPSTLGSDGIDFGTGVPLFCACCLMNASLCGVRKMENLVWLKHTTGLADVNQMRIHWTRHHSLRVPHAQVDARIHSAQSSIYSSLPILVECYEKSHSRELLGKATRPNFNLERLFSFGVFRKMNKVDIHKHLQCQTICCLISQSWLIMSFLGGLAIKLT